MAYAVLLELDPLSAGALEGAQRALEHRAGLEPAPVRPVPPHLSIAIHETLESEALERRLDAFAASVKPPKIVLSSLGVFGGEPAVLFAAPTPTASLLELHRQYHAAFADLAPSCWAYYRPGAWVPHVTLAENLSGHQLARAVEALAPAWTPVTARAELLSLVRFHPVERLHKARLGGTLER